MRTGKPTPRKSVRNFCLDCAGGAAEVPQCMGETRMGGPCMFLPYRMAKGRPSVKLIRRFCVKTCMNDHPTLVKDCQTTACYLWLYRMGRDPAKGVGRAFISQRGELRGGFHA